MTIDVEDGGRWQRLQPRERALIVIFGLIAVLAVVYLLFVSGGGKEPEAIPTTPTRPTSSAQPTVSPSATPTIPPDSSEVFEGKDPFRPLVGAPAPTGQPTTEPGSSGGPSGQQRVTLVDITGTGANRTATVEVNSQEYQVQVGDTFAGSYKVKSLSASCGTFMFGDESFTLCVGQEVIK